MTGQRPSFPTLLFIPFPTMFSRIAAAAVASFAAFAPLSASAAEVQLDAYVRGTNNFASCEIKSGGNFFEQELAQTSRTQADQAQGNRPTGIHLDFDGDVTLAVSPLEQLKPVAGNDIALADSYIDVKVNGNRLRADDQGESIALNNRRNSGQLHMDDARITVPNGMATGTEYRISTTLTCLVTP